MEKTEINIEAIAENYDSETAEVVRAILNHPLFFVSGTSQGERRAIADEACAKHGMTVAEAAHIVADLGRNASGDDEIPEGGFFEKSAKPVPEREISKRALTKDVSAEELQRALELLKQQD